MGFIAPAFLLLLLVLLTTVHGASASAECSDLDIRNKVSNLNVLRNCTVVYGYLQIVLMDRPNNNFTGVSFPDLREITGFLILFRVMGLTDLGQLFPNLVVIRGAALFHDYALIVYNLPDLKFMGLKNLLAIERGSVRIVGCEKLCHATDVDWSLITLNEGAANNVIPKQVNKQCDDISVACSSCPMKGKCWAFDKCQKTTGDFITKCETG